MKTMLQRVVASLFAIASVVITTEILLLSGSPAATATTAVKLIHLLCFATSLGATVWAIFVSGLVMFMNLPRHMMGSLRSKVFPACFMLTAVCSTVSAAAFACLHRLWQGESERRELVVLVSAAGFDLANLLLFAPKVLKVMQERHKVERSLGIGDTGFLEGWRSNARAAMVCADLAAVNVRFRTAHSLSALATIASTAALVVHSTYLAGKLAL